MYEVSTAGEILGFSWDAKTCDGKTAGPKIDNGPANTCLGNDSGYFNIGFVIEDRTQNFNQKVDGNFLV